MIGLALLAAVVLVLWLRRRHKGRVASRGDGAPVVVYAAGDQSKPVRVRGTFLGPGNGGRM